MSDEIFDGVRYEQVDYEYLEKRQLGKGRRANSWLLWAVAVGAVMSGHFIGWNSILPVPRIWDMVFANLLVALMYGCFVFSLAELSTALPHAGGFYSYVRYAFGPLAGFVCGITVTIQYIFLAAISIGITAQLLESSFGQPAYLWALLLIAILLAITIRGTRITFRVVALLFGVLSIAVLIIFSLVVLYTESFEVGSFFYVATDVNPSMDWLPKGLWGIFTALPFAILLYLPVEQVAFAAEELHHPTEEIPAALKRGFATLFGLSFLTLLFISGSAHGAITTSALVGPVHEILSVIFPLYDVYFRLITIGVFMASALTFINTSGRIIFALSRAGYFPRQLSLTSRYQTPNRALILAAVVGWLCFYLLELVDAGYGQRYLTQMVIFSAILCYLFVIGSYLQLKRKHPKLSRPYQSPLSDSATWLTFFLAFIFLFAFLTQPHVGTEIIAVGLILLLSTLYFVFQQKKRQLVFDAPEEKQALLGKSKVIMVPDLTVKRAVVVVLLLVAFRFIITYDVITLTSGCPPVCTGASMIREDFSNSDLRDINFIEANLLQSNFEKADLRDANFSGANLVDASLVNADLSGAKLIGADLTGADLGGATMNHTDLRGAILNESNLINVDLTSARLDGISLQNARLTGTDMTGVNLAGVELTLSEMKRIKLFGANLAGSTLSGADLSGAFLSKSNLTGAWLNKSNLTGADFEGADLSGASLIGANLSSTNLSNSKMIGSTIIGATFLGANLIGANLKEADFRKSELNPQDLKDDSFLNELNDLQKEEISQDANLSGVQSNNETVWPSSEFSSSILLDVEDMPEEVEFSEDAIKTDGD